MGAIYRALICSSRLVVSNANPGMHNIPEAGVRASPPAYSEKQLVERHIPFVNRRTQLDVLEIEQAAIQQV